MRTQEFSREDFDEIDEKTLGRLKRETVSELKMFLKSSFFQQIGPVMANRIVGWFGVETIHIIEKFPKKLGQVPGVGRLRIYYIIYGWQAQKRMKEMAALILAKRSDTDFS